MYDCNQRSFERGQLSEEGLQESYGGRRRGFVNHLQSYDGRRQRSIPSRTNPSHTGHQESCESTKQSREQATEHRRPPAYLLPSATSTATTATS
eukprot:5499645-Pyramimonas_sp.AAC.1